MKRKLRQIGAFLAITIMMAGCQKEEIIESINYDYANGPKYNITYRIGDISQAKTLHGEEEYEALLDSLIQQAMAGDVVWVSAIGNANPEDNPQEPIVFCTYNEREARQWVLEMISRGFSVSIEYNEATRLYTCTAVIPSHN